MKFDVTQEMIDESFQKMMKDPGPISCNCVIAVALKPHFTVPVSVGTATVTGTVGVLGLKGVYFGNLDREAFRYRQAFDHIALTRSSLRDPEERAKIKPATLTISLKPEADQYLVNK